MLIAGCVSLSYTLLRLENYSQSLCDFLYRRIMSYNDVEQKKYYCFNRSSFPASVESFGYKTLVIYSADYLSPIAPK